MKTIYVISTGSYSDYTVHAAFETEADALIAKSLFDRGWETADIEELPYFPASEQPVHIILHQVSATVKTSGAAPHEYDQPPAIRASLMTWEWNRSPASEDKLEIFPTLGGRGVMLQCLSVDAERAMKIVADEYAKQRAEREGL